MQYQKLYESYDNAAQNGFADFKSLGTPKYIADNLRLPAREYQKEAIGRWLWYMDRDTTNKKSPVQLLYNMATGSGKTYVMAALILDLYRRGRRNFIFFVNSTNIIEKTRDNFLNPASLKYLFANNIMINGEAVAVRETSNFADADSDAINLMLTTTQGLHSDLNNTRENRLTYDELAEYNVVMIGDEAHHNNAGLSRAEEDDNRSWEATVNNILKVSREPILLEFTATIDMDDASIAQKYRDRMIYRYDLRAFRKDKFSKDVLIYAVDGNVRMRELQAMIISQYRKKVALKNGVWLKPVVMFKSETIAKSKENFEAFSGLVNGLAADDIAAARTHATDILANAFGFYDTTGISDADLAAELKDDFRAERLVLMDGKNVTADKQQIVNTLENPDNEFRAIFTVDMLKEGWDVLNLFDIVRLYEKRDGGGHGEAYKAGKTTLSEAQLIGRGARYFPFILDNPDEKYLRKFDNDENNEMRVLEQLHYHSKNDVRYIAEIKQTLDKTGITNFSNTVDRTLRLKENFKKTQTYIDGKVWMNQRVPKLAARQQTLLSDELLELPPSVEVNLPTGFSREISVFGEETFAPANSKDTITIHIGKEIAPNVVRAAMNRNKNFTFNKLEKFHFASRAAFIEKLREISIVLSGNADEIRYLNQEQKLYIASALLDSIENEIDEEIEKYIGTEKFTATPISEVFLPTIKRKYTLGANDDSEGYPQKESPTYPLNLALENWYAYDENYGTSEEKSLAVTLKAMIGELEKKWSDIYLLRNERGAVRIYNFNDGRATEPDFLLFANDKKSGNISYQIFIEPKGDQFIGGDGTFASGKEGWKEKFYAQISDKTARDPKILIDDDHWRIVGLPFYNENHTKTDFETIINEL